MEELPKIIARLPVSIAETNHGARMLAAVCGTELLPTEKIVTPLSDTCKSQTFSTMLGASFLCDKANSETTKALVKSGLASPEITLTLADKLAEKIAQGTRDDDLEIDPLILSDPVIGIERVEKFANISSKMTAHMRAAYSTNPLYKERYPLARKPDTHSLAFIRAACRHGDLTDSHVAIGLATALSEVSHASRFPDKFDALLQRPELPEELAAIFDQHQLSPERYMWLTKTKSHQSLVEKSKVAPFRKFADPAPDGTHRSEMVLFSRAAPADAISEVYREARRSATGAESLLAATTLVAKNAPRAHLLHAWSIQNVSLLDPLMAESPFATEILTRNMKYPLSKQHSAVDLTIACHHSTAAHLLHALEQTKSPFESSEKYLDVLAHPNFPWDTASVSSIARTGDPQFSQNSPPSDEYITGVAGIIIGCVRSRRFAESVQTSAIPESAKALALVFTESASARRLKEVGHGFHPDYHRLSMLAACHPNGNGLSFPSFAHPSKSALFIESLQSRYPAISLAGKTGSRQPINDPPELAI